MQFVLQENTIDINGELLVYVSPRSVLENNLVPIGTPSSYTPAPINTRYNVNLYTWAISSGAYTQVLLHTLRPDDGTIIFNGTAVESFAVRPMIPLLPDTDYILELKDMRYITNSATRTYEVIPRQIFKIRAVRIHKTRNANDVYYQMENMSSLANVENILYGLDYTNYKFNPVTYNPDLKRYYGETDINHQPVMLTADNAKTMKDLFLKSYMLEYQNYFTDMDNRNDPAVSSPFALTYSDKQINDLNLFIIKNISKYNSIKGTKLLMEFIMGLYATILGYSLVSVVEDSAQACLYRITSSIPRDFWERNIKPIVHPTGWSDLYSQIDSLNDGAWVTAYREPDRMRTQFNMYTKSYLKEHHDLHFQHKRDAHRLHLINHTTGVIEPYNAVTHGQLGHQYCGWLNHRDEAKFNVMMSSHQQSTDQVSGANNFFYDYPTTDLGTYATSGFSVSGVWYSAPVYVNAGVSAWRPKATETIETITLKDRILLSYNYGFAVDERKIGQDRQHREFDFRLPGIALDYIYEIWRDNALVMKTNNLHSVYDKDMRDIDHASTSFFRVKETIRRDDWYYENIHQYDDFYQLGYKNIIDRYGDDGHRRQYISYLASDGMSANDNASLGHYSSHHIRNLTGMQPQTYQTMPTTGVDDLESLLNSWDSIWSFSVTVSAINNTDSRINIKWKYPGLAHKYVWRVTTGGFFEDIITFHNEINYAIKTADVSTANFQLTIVIDDYVHIITSTISQP
jgi:hypothetical protein